MRFTEKGPLPKNDLPNPKGLLSQCLPPQAIALASCKGYKWQQHHRQLFTNSYLPYVFVDVVAAYTASPFELLHFIHGVGFVFVFCMWSCSCKLNIFSYLVHLCEKILTRNFDTWKFSNTKYSQTSAPALQLMWGLFMLAKWIAILLCTLKPQHQDWPDYNSFNCFLFLLC